MLNSEPQWVAVYTSPRAEKKVVKNVAEAGFEAYLPLRRELHEWSDRKKWVETPLIKSYIFVKITKKQLVPLLNVDGVSFIIRFRGEVATIPDWEIQMMKDFLAEEYDVHMREISLLKPGTKVKINSGALEGRVGMLVSDCEEGNFAVEITGISMAMVIYIDMDMLDVLPEDEQPVQEKTKEYNIR